MGGEKKGGGRKREGTGKARTGGEGKGGRRGEEAPIERKPPYQNPKHATVSE